MPKLTAFCPALLCLGLAAPTCLLAQPAPRVGSEFQVNTYTTGAQRYAALAVETDGDFIVTWLSADQDGSANGVFARRFSAAGVSQASEFQVSVSTLNSQNRPAVAVDGDGDFVVVWQSDQDGGSYGVFGRRFNAAGVAQAAEFQVNGFTLGVQASPAVAIDAAGDFVVAWDSAILDGNGYGVFARRFSSAGTAQATELQVNSYIIGNQQIPALSLDADGDFVIAWSSYGQDGSGYGVFARRFNSAGSAQAVELQVNNHTTGHQRVPSVALDADGGFVIAWHDSALDGDGYGAFARRFNAGGVALASEFQLNVYTAGNERFPALSMDADGGFIATWHGDFHDGSGFGVFGRRFAADATPLAAEFQVNAYTPGNQVFSALGLDGDGDFVVAWQSVDQDGSGDGVFAQRFAAPAVLDIDANGTVAPLTDGLLVLRYLFGFTGGTLTAGAVDLAGCTRCSAPAIEAYLSTLI